MAMTMNEWWKSDARVYQTRKDHLSQPALRFHFHDSDKTRGLSVSESTTSSNHRRYALPRAGHRDVDAPQTSLHRRRHLLVVSVSVDHAVAIDGRLSVTLTRADEARQARDLLSRGDKGLLEGFVLILQEFDLGLKLRKPCLLALPTLESS